MDNFINESTVVALATVIFTTTLFRPIKKALLSFLDSKIVEAATKLREAQNMKIEAEEMLMQISLELNAAKETAKEIIRSAQEKSESILDDAKIEFEKTSKRKTELAMERISQQEKSIVNEFTGEVLGKALKQVELSLTKNLTDTAKNALIENSLINLKRNLN